MFLVFPIRLILTSPCFGPTLSIIYANFNNPIQVHIPLQKSRHSFVTKIKCHVTSSTTHGVLISKEVSWKSYKEICSGEPKKVNLGYLGIGRGFVLQNNSLVPQPRVPEDFIYGINSEMSHDWEVLFKFFSIHNIQANWLDCHYNAGYYDEDLGGWTGCLGKV